MRLNFTMFFRSWHWLIYDFYFLIMVFNFIKAAESSKSLNFTSNIAAWMMFLLLESVNYTYGLCDDFKSLYRFYNCTKQRDGLHTNFIYRCDHRSN